MPDHNSGPAARLQRAVVFVPGLALCAITAAGVMTLHQIIGLGLLGPIMAAMLLGLGWRLAFGLHPVLEAGARFTARTVLRAAVVLLGLRVAVQDVAALGWSGAAVCAIALIACWRVTVMSGRALGVDANLTRLIAGGVSVCGASAAAAVGAATGASEDDVAYAIAGITVAGSVAMLSLPWLGVLLDLSPAVYGLWVGASVHEVAQAAAAATALGEETGTIGMVAKLTRVLMLAPLILLLTHGPGARRAKTGQGQAAAVPFPWFILGFAALAAVASIWPLPPSLAAPHALLTTGLLAAALAGMGLLISPQRLIAHGWRPLFLCGLVSLFISGLALGLALISERLPF